MDDLQKEIKELEEISNLETEGAGKSAFPRSVVYGVIVLSVLVVVVTFSQLKHNLVLNIPSLGDGDLVFQNDDTSLLEADDEQLKLTDSDQDGLSDYLELREIGSSPFIADSDSDGISDAIEYNQGTDPNCPEGESCFNAPNLDDTPTDIAPFDFSTVASDPDSLRLLLIDSGADPNLVNSLDDQTLQALAAQTLADMDNPQSSVKLDELEVPEGLDLNELNVDELRQLLIEGGLTAEESSQLTDQQLLDVFAQFTQ